MDQADSTEQGQNVSLTAKEKLSEKDVQPYKYWFIDRSLEDCFESLVEWVELRVQIMEEAKKEINGVGGDRTRAIGFTTRSQAKGCTADTCKNDHPPWVYKNFKELPVLKRRMLIGSTGRCYRCLAAGHHSKEAQHWTGNEHPREQTYSTRNSECIFLMILQALISNGNNELRINATPDPCSTSSFVSSEEAGERLELHGQSLNLSIAGTGETEIRKRSCRVGLTVANVDDIFSSPLQAYVSGNIAGDTPAIPWTELKRKWPQLRHVPFESVSRQRQVDVMIGSHHPVFHHVLREACGNQSNDPVVRLTNLGWVSFGHTLMEGSLRNCPSHFTRTYNIGRSRLRGKIAQIVLDFY